VLTPEVIEQMYKYCRRTGLKWLCKLPNNTSVEFTDGILDTLRLIPKNGTVLDKVNALRPLIDSGLVSRQMLEALHRGGYLASKYPRRELAKNLGGSLKGFVAHHDYPVTRELDFILAGIDINAGASSGRWLPTEFHKKIHNAPGWPTSGRGGPWIYQWEKFFREIGDQGRAPSSQEIETFRDLLRSVTNDFSRTAEQIDWPFKQQ